MNTVILTAIKDEHQYLDEWIRYHLGIGFKHIFIIEDFDSESHDEIVKPYSQWVTLIPMSSILSEDESNEAKEFKITKRKNPQDIYLRRGLKILSEKNEYDWCFVIDVDEFITPVNDGSSIDDVMFKYTNYDAVIFQWKCFGANGLVYTPDYTDKGVVEIYTEPIKGMVPTATLKSYTKTAYNMRTYCPEFYKYTHQPTDKCNACRTDFSTDREKEVYDIAYIRHYITRSWEEYVWKWRERGYFYGVRRKLNTFFTINPDMAWQQDRLLYESDERQLIVLPYVQGRAQGQELRLTLSGWRKFCQSNYDFVVIGDFDKSLRREFRWVTFIDFKQREMVRGQYYPHLDIQNKMMQIYRIFGRRYSGFIWICDDNYAIKPFSIDEIVATHFHEPSFIGDESAPTSFWKHDKWKTRQLLDAEGLPHVNYTTHFPCYFSFERLRALWDKYDMHNNSYVVEDIYFNTYPHDEPIKDSTIRYGVWGPKWMGQPLEDAIADPNIKFLCNSVEGWSRELEDRVASLVFDPEP